MQRSEGTMWSDTKIPWEDLAREDMEQIIAWLKDVADNWSFMEKTVGFSEFGHLGNTYSPTRRNNEPIQWIPEKDLYKENIFKNLQTPLGSADNTLTPVVKVDRYKNWIRQMCNRGGYCYLILFQRKYRPYAFLVYGKNPQLGDLNLSDKYRSNVFKELNVAINYTKKLIHVYRAKNVIYAEGFEKYKDNEQLIGNWWLPHYIVGATEVETERVGKTTVAPEPVEIHHHSDYVHPEDESASHTIGRHGRDAAGPSRPNREYINTLMTGGMTAIQGHMTSLQEQEIKRQLEHYKKKAERLERKHGKRREFRPSTPGSGRGSSNGSDPDSPDGSHLFDSGGPSEPNTDELEIL